MREPKEWLSLVGSFVCWALTACCSRLYKTHVIECWVEFFELDARSWFQFLILKVSMVNRLRDGFLRSGDLAGCCFSHKENTQRRFSLFQGKGRDRVSLQVYLRFVIFSRFFVKFFPYDSF